MIHFLKVTPSEVIEVNEVLALQATKGRAIAVCDRSKLTTIDASADICEKTIVDNFDNFDNFERSDNFK